MSILLMIIFGVFVAYNAFVIAKFGIPESISATSYLFSECCKKRWLFSLLCVVLGIGLYIPWINLDNVNNEGLIFFTCLGILFDGATPYYREDLQGKVHYTSGIILALCFITWFIINHLWSHLILGALLTAILIKIRPKSYVYFGEVIAFIVLIAYLSECYK